MSMYTVGSVVSCRSSRPAFFPQSDFARSVGPLCSASSVPNMPSASIGDISTREGNFSVINGFGGRLNGNSSSARNVFDKPFHADCANDLNLASNTTDGKRTFLQEISCRETADAGEKDLLVHGFKAELHPRCQVSKSETVQTGKTTHVPSVSSLDLVGLMVKPELLMIIDCRNFLTYNSNHIKSALNVNLANKITRKRFVDGHLTVHDLVSGPEAKAEYDSKERTAVIVIYDDNTTNVTSLPPAHPLKLLSNRLQSKGLDVRYLEGGIQSFQDNFRQFCEHPDAPPTPAMLYSPTSQDVDAAVDTATASQILPFLFIGNERDAANKQTLKELGITHILNVTAQIPFHFDDHLLCKRLKATDSGCQNLKQYFKEAIEFIEIARISNGRVLVHCQAGVSRSPTIVMAYIMARFGKSLQDAFSFVHSCRNIISPNLNFMGQLLEFGQRPDLLSFFQDPVPCKCPDSALN